MRAAEHVDAVLALDAMVLLEHRHAQNALQALLHILR